MLEYRWKIPPDGDAEATLTLRAGGGWLARKQLQFRDRIIFRRGWFEGIDARFSDSTTGSSVRLQLEQEDDGVHWRPVLSIDGQQATEISATPLPRVPRRTKSIAWVTGLTYLTILLAAVMLQPIRSILLALRLPHHDRKFVLHVNDPAIDDQIIRVDTTALVPFKAGEPYTARLSAVGGEPPYTWQTIRDAWLRLMSLDSTTGEISFATDNRHDLPGAVIVMDRTGRTARSDFVIPPARPGPQETGWPTIATVRLPPATIGEPYQIHLESSQGSEAMRWQRLDGRWPLGLALDQSTGVLEGTPVRRRVATFSEEFAPSDRPDSISAALRAESVQLGEDVQVLSTEQSGTWKVLDGEERYLLSRLDNLPVLVDDRRSFPVTLRVSDTRYNVWDEIKPWVAPTIVTAVCLLGFWNMGRWSVVAMCVLLACQIVLDAVGVMNISHWAMIIEGALCLVGAVNWSRMQ